MPRRKHTNQWVHEPFAEFSSSLIASMIITIVSCGTAATINDRSPSTKEYYVSTTGSDSNDGSAAHPWRTIQHASSLVTAGYTVHVRPGTYNAVGTGGYPAQITAAMTASASGTASARIRFISDTKWGATIVTSGGSYYAWEVDGNYVDIMGFEITGDAAVGLRLNGSHQRAIGNHVHDLVVPCDGNGGAGINDNNYTASDNDFIGNVVHDIHPPAGCADDHGPGIYVANLRARVWNNLVFRTQEGIQLWHAASNVTISDNTVFNTRQAGILVGCGDNGCVISDYNIVSDNIVYGNTTTYGIREEGTTGTHNQYLNNLVYLNQINWSLQNGNTHSGDVTADPQFVNYTGDATGDYHLKSTSPAIDRGTNVGAPSDDINGGLRPVGSNWDIGAYEWGAPAGVWPWQ